MASEGRALFDEQEIVVKHTFVHRVTQIAAPTLRRSLTDSALCCVSTSEKSWMDFDEVGSAASTAASVHPDDYDTDEEWSDGDQYSMDQHNEPSWVPVCVVPMQWADQNTLVSQILGLGEEFNEEWQTTVMLRNIPIEYTCEMLLELLNSMGFGGTYDFVYLPIDHKSEWGKGYAFINLISAAHAQYFMKSFEGFSNWVFPSNKVCTCTWSHPTQGLEANIARYRDSPIMHPSRSAEWKPLVFRQGVLDIFPPPTRAIKAPRF